MSRMAQKQKISAKPAEPDSVIWKDVKHAIVEVNAVKSSTNKNNKLIVSSIEYFIDYTLHDNNLYILVNSNKTRML